MVVGAKVFELTDGSLWFVCGLYVGILTSPLIARISAFYRPKLALIGHYISRGQ